MSCQDGFGISSYLYYLFNDDKKSTFVEKISNHCLICNDECDKDSKTVYCEVTKHEQLEKTDFSPIYEKTKHEEFICENCSRNLITCQICDGKFDHQFIQSVYVGIESNKQVNLCIICYSHNACDGCENLCFMTRCHSCQGQI